MYSQNCLGKSNERYLRQENVWNDVLPDAELFLKRLHFWSGQHGTFNFNFHSPAQKFKNQRPKKPVRRHKKFFYPAVFP
jgi:hypothetical protein